MSIYHDLGGELYLLVGYTMMQDSDETSERAIYGAREGGRNLNGDEPLEVAIAIELGREMRSSPTLCAEVWSALANVTWMHEDGDEVGYSYRAAGDLIAAVIGRGDYLDWYCSGPSGVISDRVAESLARHGWQGRPI